MSMYNWSIFVSPITVPTPDVTVTAQSATSLRVAIKMMEALRYSASITGYKFSFARSGYTPSSYTVSTTSHTYTVDFTALDPYIRYSVQVTVILSGITTEAWSTTQYVTTHEDSK